jgi:hypothetical protein
MIFLCVKLYKNGTVFNLMHDARVGRAFSKAFLINKQRKQTEGL